jgi:DNA-binding NarL/FixJ family response regulator
MSVLTILLVDDHSIMREELASLLSQEAELRVVGQANGGQAALRMITELNPDIVLMDISMPDMSGIEVTQQCMASSPNTRIIALSMHSDQETVRNVLQAGACGYLLKDTQFKELLHAIRVVGQGQQYLGSGVTAIVLQDYLQRLHAPALAVSSPLTTREQEVLQLVARGLSNKEIGNQLCVSVKTVETHRRNIMEKLDLHTVAELTRYALEHGLS